VFCCRASAAGEVVKMLRTSVAVVRLSSRRHIAYHLPDRLCFGVYLHQGDAEHIRSWIQRKEFTTLDCWKPWLYNFDIPVTDTACASLSLSLNTQTIPAILIQDNRWSLACVQNLANIASLLQDLFLMREGITTLCRDKRVILEAWQRPIHVD